MVEKARVDMGRQSAPAPTQSRVGIGKPAVIPLTEGLIGDDKELLAFWQAQKDDYRFDYVALSCCFEPKDAPFAKAWVKANLECPEATEAPIAWSLAPREVIDTHTVTKSVNLGADFALNAGGQIGSSDDEKEWFVRAYEERSSHPPLGVSSHRTVPDSRELAALPGRAQKGSVRRLRHHHYGGRHREAGVLDLLERSVLG